MPWKSAEITVQELAKKLNAQIRGAGVDRPIRRVAALEDEAPDAISFTTRFPSKTPKCGALLCEESVAEKLKDTTCIVVKEPFRAMLEIAPIFFELDSIIPGVHPSAVIEPGAEIAGSAWIGAFCYVGRDVKIGANTKVFPHACIYPRSVIGNSVTIHAHAVVREDTEIGDHVVLQPGAVIGADGFGYVPDPKLGLMAVPQMGSVKLNTSVDVGANSCIDRATLGKTTLGVGTKVDNLVQIGHNVKIGNYSIICGQAGIAGSCTIGDQVVMGGNAGVADHIQITSKVRLAAKTGVVQDILEPGDYAGFPALPAREWRLSLVGLRRLANQLRKSRAKSKHEE